MVWKTKIVEVSLRIVMCLAVASLILLVQLFLMPEGPPLKDIATNWLGAHLGPLLLLNSPNRLRCLLMMGLCLAMILPAAFKQNAWRIAFCTGGFVLWLQLGFYAIVATI